MDHSNMDHGDMDHGDMDHSNMDHGTMGHGSMDHSMAMYFHFSSSAIILFKGWAPTTTGQMFGSCLVMILIAMMYEGLKVLREKLLQRTLVVHCNGEPLTVATNDGDVPPCENHKTCTPGKRRQCQMMSLAHFIQTILHVIQFTVSYALMLVFMTYNVWLCLAVIAGTGIGYFLFGWRRANVLDANEHCH